VVRWSDYAFYAANFLLIQPHSARSAPKDGATFDPTTFEPVRESQDEFCTAENRRPTSLGL
jgi:hypothetical protein